MAQPITAIAGKYGLIKFASATAKLVGWTCNINNSIIEYATTGQTADDDSQYWMNVLSGLNSATLEVEGYWDNTATAANQWTGATYGVRPGTGTVGVATLGFTTTANNCFVATVVVESISAGTNAESNKPATFRATLRVDGAVTYPSA